MLHSFCWGLGFKKFFYEFTDLIFHSFKNDLLLFCSANRLLSKYLFKIVIVFSAQQDLCCTGLVRILYSHLSELHAMLLKTEPVLRSYH